MNALIFDTETTGFPNRNQPFDHECQPQLVQLAAILFDLKTEKVRGELNLLIDPGEAYRIPDQCAAIHGITTETAQFSGIPLMVALLAFHNLWKRCAVIVGHNVQFDVAIMESAYARVKRESPFSATPKICTMEAMTPIMELPPTERQRAAGFTRFKKPTLGEASKYIGRLPFDAHDGMADARETLEVFRFLRNSGRLK